MRTVQKEPVKFMVTLEKNVDGNEVKNSLEKLAEDISLNVQNLNNLHLIFLHGTTSKETYERVFNTELVYEKVSAGYNPNKPDKEPSYVYTWRQIREAQIPNDLKAKIKYIEVNQPIFLIH